MNKNCGPCGLFFLTLAIWTCSNHSKGSEAPKISIEKKFSAFGDLFVGGHFDRNPCCKSPQSGATSIRPYFRIQNGKSFQHCNMIHFGTKQLQSHLGVQRIPCFRLVISSFLQTGHEHKTCSEPQSTLVEKLTMRHHETPCHPKNSAQH